MKTLFERYKELNIDNSLICLEEVNDICAYFCYPTNAKANSGIVYSDEYYDVLGIKKP